MHITTIELVPHLGFNNQSGVSLWSIWSFTFCICISICFALICTYIILIDINGTQTLRIISVSRFWTQIFTKMNVKMKREKLTNPSPKVSYWIVVSQHLLCASLVKKLLFSPLCSLASISFIFHFLNFFLTYIYFLSTLTYLLIFGYIRYHPWFNELRWFY